MTSPTLTFVSHFVIVVGYNTDVPHIQVMMTKGVPTVGVRASIDSKGRLFVPAEIRRETGIGERENVVLQVIGPGEFKVTGVRNLVAKSKGMYGYLRREGESIADELIEERRREARSELNDQGRA